MADVDSSLKNWSTTASSNSPSGSTTIGTGLDDNLREIQAVVRQLADTDTIASATTTDIGSKDKVMLTVSGGTTITGFGTVSAGVWKVLIFSGAPLLTHNGTSLILPDAINYQCVAGDVAIMLSEGSGNWRCLALLNQRVFQRYYETVNTVASSGAAETLTLDNTQDVTLDANCTFTFPSPTSGHNFAFTLILRQDATGSRTVTWPASVDWASATAPTLSTGASDVDVFTFMTVDGGTTWLGFTAGLDLS